MRLLTIAAAVGVLGVSACSGGSGTTAGPTVRTSAPAATTAPAPTAPAATTSPSTKTTTTTASADGESEGASSSDESSSGLSADDRLAGLRNTTVKWSAGGTLKVVPGSSSAPGKGRVYRVKVEVESGIDLDRQKFATYVLATLNAPRSWTENGRRRFARTDGAADIVVVLASPQKSASICAPLRTFGKLSCRHGDMAVLTMYRWVKGIPEYADHLDGYRRYVVNHEVGHTLGHAHEYCAGKGKRAPVMMQQTKGLKGCALNSWPFTDR